MQKLTANKINYIDNLRVLLTILVILHHTCITYGAPGGWYYTDKTSNETILIFMTFFVATNQSFFMGFFFLLAALFTEPSYNKKGASKFITDRLKRLGIPLIFYSFIFSPILNFLVYKFGYNKPATFLQFLGGYDDWIDFGVLWFVAALLIFTLVYVMLRKFFSNAMQKNFAFPTNNNIFFFALSLGIISYLARIIFPVGKVLHPLGFQPAHFTQYIALFITGIIASRNNWLNKIDYKRGKRWLIISIILILSFPLLYIIKIITKSPIEALEGGGTLPSLLNAVWEQLTGISIIVALFGICKQKWNYSTPLLQSLARASLATYILHPLAVISIALILHAWHIEPALKFLISAPIVVIISFIMGMLVVKLPLVKDVV